MKMPRLFSVVLASFVILFSTTIFVSASEGDETGEVDKPEIITVTYEEANPIDGFLYFRKRLSEKLTLFFFSFSKERKEAYWRELADRRLSELKFVVENNDMANFEKATTRYSATVGMWADFIIDKSLTSKKEPSVVLLTSHIPALEELAGKYDGTTAEWRFMKQDIDYVKIYISSLQE